MKNLFIFLSKTVLSVLITGIIVLSSASSAFSGTPRTYDIQMFETDQYNRGPVSSAVFFFDSKPYVEDYTNITLEVIYSNAEIILPRVSFLTIAVNNIPLASREVNSRNPDTASFKITVPKDKLLPGFNEIKIVSILRTSDDPCKDIYNNACWLRILKSSTMHVEAVVNNNYPLYYYPYPYIDTYMKNPIQASVFLAQKPSTNEIENVLKLISDWGIGSPFGNFNFRVSTDATGVPGRQIKVGDITKLGTDGMGVSEGNGLVKRDGGPDRDPVLFVSGKGTEGLNKSVSALTNTGMVNQMDSTYSIITKFPNVTNTNKKSTKAGLFTLNQLGFPQIVLAGIFNQRKAFIFRRPLNYDISNDSYIKVNFYHSDVMNPRMSILVIYINGVPVGSAALNETNAKGGSFTVKIPDSELDKNEWSVEFSAYHEIGGIKDINCDHWYDDLVWTVVEGTSELYLSPGNYNAPPSLKNIPFAITDNGLSSDPIVFWLPSKMNDSHLTLAGLIAAKSGQANKQLTGYRVVVGDDIDDSLKKSSTIVMLAYQNEGARWSKLKDKLPVTPQGQGYAVDKNFNTINNELTTSSAILQACVNPWNSKGVVYSIMVDNDNTVNTINNILTNRESFMKLNGPLCLVKKDGRIVEVSPAKSMFKNVEKTTNVKLWYFLVGAVLILALLLIIFRRKIFRQK